MDNPNDNIPENGEESGLKGAQSLNRNQLDLLKKLAAIGSDLWGGMPSAAYQKEETPDKPAREKQEQPELKEKKENHIENTIRNLWKTADETVDWTDALAHSMPTDGLTGKRLWGFYHKMAEKVLSGDLNAYIYNHPEKVDVFTRDRERFKLLGVEGNPAGTLKLCFERYYEGGDDE